MLRWVHDEDVYRGKVLQKGITLYPTRYLDISMAVVMDRLTEEFKAFVIELDSS
jgi:hypothetical protein